MSLAFAKKGPVLAGDDAQPFDFAGVYKRHVQTVARWVARLGGPGTDVEDAVQDVFVAVQRTLPKFRGEAALSTWLYRITANTMHRRRRRDGRWKLRRAPDGAAARVASPEASADERLEAREATRRVYAALDRLPDKYRTLMILFELEELPGERVAELTATKPATVWVQLHRARRLFLEELKKGEAP